MDIILEVPAVSARTALVGMRSDFVSAFGRGWVGRRLADTAWATFCAALAHGLGIAVAEALCGSAVEEHNARILLVAQWPRHRVIRTVSAAVERAASAE